MPQPGKTENVEPKVDIIPSETPQAEEKITIDATTGAPVVPQTQVQSSVSHDEFKKIQARMEYQARQNERLQSQLAETLQRLNQPTPQRVETKQADDDFDPALDAIAKDNWQKGVGALADKRATIIAEKKFAEMMEKRDREQQSNFTRQQSMNQLEKEKSWVLDKTPSLNDESSDDFRGYYATYNKMIAEDPSLVQNPRAPRLVWHEWRAESGNTAPSPVANAEAERLKRVAAGATPQSRQVTSGKKTYQLTAEQIQFCKDSGLSPAAYAKSLEYNFKEGVTA